MTAKHKGGLAVVLGIGFVLTLPLVLRSTPEEKQHLVEDTTQTRLFKQHIGGSDVFAMTSAERKEIAKTLEQDIKNTSSSEQETWITHVLPQIMMFDVSPHQARSIAKWTWLNAQEQHLEPALILALMTIESRFDPFATSAVGAQGLMQVMPFWKKELGNPDDDLFDVKTNIRYGSVILKHYIKRYGSAQKALAAYNGSKGRVKYPNKVMSQIHRYQF